MRWLFFFLFLPVLSYGAEINERDMQAIKQLLNEKRDHRLTDKHDSLSISGDIRFEIKNIKEERDESAAAVPPNGVKTKERSNDSGSFGTAPIAGTLEFGVEFNLYVDYTADQTWAHVHLEFDNDGGITHDCDSNNNGNYECGSGECDQICLKSAYFGYNILDDDHRLDIEVGRWDMYNIFDSMIQFQNRYDGLLLTYSTNFEDVGDFYVKGGMFVIDSLASNWGYAAEVALLDLMEIGLDLKYSFTDYTKGSDRSGWTYDQESPCVRAWKARISQFSAAYNFEPDWTYLNQPTTIYGAFLINHSAKAAGTPSSVGKENLAFYVGIRLGKIEAEGDWSVDINYQRVEAQSIPDFAVSGIGAGNVRGTCYHKASIMPINQLGNVNYQGLQVDSAYALTENLTFISEGDYSWEVNSDAFNAGTTGRKYIKSELELMYSF